MRRLAASVVAGARRRLRDEGGRRVAFLLEAVDQRRGRRADRAVREAGGRVAPEDCELLAVVAHWRGRGARPSDQDGAVAACLGSLVALPVRRLEVVVLTDDVPGCEALVRSFDDAGPAVVRAERWRPRGWRRHGYHLPWGYREVFRRALGDPRLTHLLYLEDDIAFTAENLTHWLSARPALAPRGLLPGFVRFERVGGERVLVDQTRSGQHRDAGPAVDVEGVGPVTVRLSERPYQACSFLDRALAVEHLSRSPFRSPLRSLVVRWDLRERAAAGATFGPSVHPLRGVLRPSAVRPPIRSAVLLAGGDGSAGGLLEGVLIEHLRPTYSRDPASRHGKVRVEDF